MRKFTIIGFFVALVVASGLLGQHFNHSRDARLGRQIAGTWTKNVTSNRMTFSWTNPAIFTRTISSDGTFSESLGHRSVLVTYQGTWLVKNGGLVMTVTNAQGTGNHAAGPVGGVDRCQIIQVDDHQFISETGGHTNTWSR